VKAALALVAAMLATGLHGATGEAVGTLLASSNVPVAAGNSIASAPAPVLVAARAASERANVAAPAEPAYESTFTPLTALPAQVKAPSVKQTSAFVALNALLSAQTRFSEDVIGMSVSLQRAQAADAAGAQLWYLRQTNASAEYAGFAADVVSGFPALQTTMAQAFVADKMSLTLTPAQVAAAKAKLRQGPPAAFMQVLQVAAAPYQHSGAPEAAAIRAAILGATPTLQAELADLPATALVLPAVLASSSITTAEVRLASALRSYSHSILLPVREASPAAATERPELGAGPVLDDETQGQASEALENLENGLDGLSALAKQFGGEAGEGAAETSFEPLGEAFGYAFAASVFFEAGAALDEGATADGGGDGGDQGASAGSYGDPHQMTFSRAEYDFQAAGEFTLVKSTTDDLDVQVRQEPFPGAGNIALDTATAMRVDGTVVELAANASDNLQLWVNRQPVAYAGRSLPGGGTIAVGPGGATVTWPDGTAVSVFSMRTFAAAGRVTCNAGDAIDLTVGVPPARSGHLEGLLGDPGAPPDELLGGNGAKYNMNVLTEPWASAHNFDVLYHQFAPSWRVSQQSSLFYYPKGTSTATFTDLKAPSQALTVRSMAPKTAVAAEKDCKAAGITNSYLLNECTYDVGLTNGRGVCLAAADAHVQATIGGPSAKGLPDSSGSLPAHSSAPTTTTTTAPGAATIAGHAPGPQGPGIVLVQFAQQVRFSGGGFAAVSDGQGDTFVSWTNFGKKGGVFLCTLRTGSSNCLNGTQVSASTEASPAPGTDIHLLVGHRSVRMLWFDGSDGGATVQEATATAGGAPSPSHTLEKAVTAGALMDARTGPGGHLWTLTANGDGTQLRLAKDGVAVAGPAVPWAVGYAQLAFAAGTAVIAVQKAGSLSTPVDYAWDAGGSWTALRPLAGTWSVGYAPGLTQTGAGLRLVTATADASYKPVVSRWTGHGFSGASPIGDTNNCAPNSAQTGSDASGRLTDVTNECGMITVDNMPTTSRAAIFRFPAKGTVAGSGPELATLASGRGWVVYALQNNTGYDQLLAVPVLLPALTSTIATSSVAGVARVSGPVSCLPVVTTPVAVVAASAGHWQVLSKALALSGKSQGSVLNGARLRPGDSYKLVGTVTFGDGQRRLTLKAVLDFKACPAP
jgi:hypothetical protein